MKGVAEEESYGILDNLKDAAVVFDMEGRILFANQIVENYGFRREEFIGTNLLEYIPAEFKSQVLEDMKKLKEGHSVEREIRVITPKGERWVEYKGSPLEGMGKNGNILVIIRDVHERKSKEDELRMLYEFTHKISSILELDELLKLTYEELKKVLDFDTYSVGLVDKKENVVRIEFSMERGRRLQKRSYKISPETSLSSWVVYHGKPLLIDSLEERIDNLPAKVHVIGGETQSFLAVPLFFRNEVIGLINIQSFKSRAYGERELRILETLSRPLAMAIGNALLYRELEEKIKKVRVERERYRTILENLIVGIVVIHNGKIIYANKLMEDALGYRTQDVMGESFLKFVHPEMREYVLENYTRRMMGLPAPRNYIIKLMDSKGHVKWAQLSTSIVDWEGTQAELVSLQDITHLKEMERRLMALVKVFRDIKMARSKEEVYEMAVNALFRVLNFSYAAVGVVEGEKIIMRKSIGYEEPDIQVLDLYGGRGVVAWVARNRRPYYVPDVQKEPLYISTGQVTRCEYATPIIVDDRVFGVLDVEREKPNSITQEERDLVDMLAEHVAVALVGLERQEELQKAKNFQELMVHILSHDLKNPLAVSSGYVEMLREEYSEEYVDGIHRALRESFNIIEKVRLFSRLGSGRIREERKNISLKERIESIGALILKKYENVKLLINMEEINIEGYPILDEVFLNIIDNAFKYGATRVSVDASEDSSVVEIRIADNGPGIPDDMKEKIFEPFERLSSQTGSGLGLAIVKMIVELHQGKVWVEDNDPQGSVFVIQLLKSMKR